MLQTNAPLNFQDYMIISTHGGLESAVVNDMIAKAKRNYVNERHTQKISVMHSSTYKDGWMKTYVRDGQKRKEVVRKTEEELYEALYQYYSALEEKPLTLADTFNLLVLRKSEQLNRSTKTIAEDKRYFSFLSQSLKDKPVAEITESDLRTWLVTYYMPKKPKEAALRKMLLLLKQIFYYGLSQKLCLYNPAEYIRYEDYAKDCNHEKKAAEERSFSDTECSALFQDAMETCTNPRSLIRMLSMETGMRAGELCAIHKSDVLDGYIHVHRQIVKDSSSKPQTFHEVGYCKNERQRPRDGRYVPRTPAIDEILTLSENLPGESEYLFHDKAGRFITPDSYEMHLRRACAKLNISTSNNHAFRIAHNSRLIEKGFSASDRALLLGQSVETNERYYSISDQRRLDHLRARLQ